jgi:flavin-binding protein dodecin
MSLSVSRQLIEQTSDDEFREYRRTAEHDLFGDRELMIDSSRLTDQAMKDLLRAANTVGDLRTIRVVESIARGRRGHFDKPIPSFGAFRPTLEAYLKADVIDGWIYVQAADGNLYPELITGISYDPGDSHRSRAKAHPTVRVYTTSYGFSRDGNYKGQFGVFNSAHSFSPQQVANRRIDDILSAAGMYKETPELRAAHTACMDRYRQSTQRAYRAQFRANGRVFQYDEDNFHRRGDTIAKRRVVHVLDDSAYAPYQKYAESSLFEGSCENSGCGAVPEHPVIRVFDLATHEFYWIHSDNLELYAYDSSLREKLVLPPTHRDLLDVLTTDIGAFVGDLIEGKSSGNVILCKGVPGVGKTLTAEVYAEVVNKPLYAIHSGLLGSSADDIEKNLRDAFQRAKAWDLVLLLDEADIFITQRGNDLEQNAIVAVFLRTLEYFDGLLFMTSNRGDLVDEAIISRCAAIINYAPPSPDDAKAIWSIMAKLHEIELLPELIDQLVRLFPRIAPRDIKMLLRLSLRVSVSRKEALTLDVFRRCAMFRAVTMETTTPS